MITLERAIIKKGEKDWYQKKQRRLRLRVITLNGAIKKTSIMLLNIRK